ncbi:MAG: LysM peptidoglycan-binding domain-containing protein [Oleiphilaceae bacterium]|nr:LysM peptidoglycan-binding domain-containing protein [Oleiphilaceae bacterium]
MLDAAAEASAEKSKNERSSISTFDEQTPPKEDTLELEATTQTYASPVPYVLQPTEHTSQHNQQEYVKESPSLTRYLDSFFYGNHNPQKTNKKASGRDFSAYGFITPTESLETLVNEELASLRETSTTDADSNLFDRIRAGFQLDLSSQNPRLEQQLRWYVNNPDYLDRTFSRAARYLHHIVEELEREGMPLELALLPLVESAYDPFAYSHGRASGLWQFIPGTGRIYGMYQTWWYDGRRDVLASTEGAIQYLKYLNKRFDGNWLHALAAYNSGSGRVSSAIRKNKAKGKPTDFWSLKLPRETRAYVPKLLAIAKVVANPKQYNISFNPIPDRPYFEVVNIEAQMDLAHAAELAQIDIEELYRLNPGFNQWATDPLGPHRLLIPVDAAETFRTALSQLNPDERITWKRYTVKSGDSLIKIAKRFQTTPSLIQQVNKLRSNLIRVNQKLLIPVASQQKQFYQLSEANRLASKQSTYRGSNGSIKIVHEVQPGDTLWELARMHKVSSRSIAKWNGKAPTDVLQPGQKLVIWSRADVNTALPASSLPQIAERDMIKRIGYRVRKGDSLARIASKFSVTIKDLINWNNLDSNKYLQPGQKLTIYVDITNS